MPPNLMELVAWRPIASPMGKVLLGIDRHGYLRTGWPDAFGHPWPERDRLDPGCCTNAAKMLARYFDGQGVDPAKFQSNVDPEAPPFYRRCWIACRTIPRGDTISYAELAERAGNPAAIRAAAGSMRANPTPLFVPCHRVIASNGSLGGFAGQRNEMSPALLLKGTLLRFESLQNPGQPSTPPAPSLFMDTAICT